MLTRIEIDGFKTFRDFAMDVPPFLVLLGRNASGKSNLFEALQFLRAASQGNLTEAARQVRGGLSNFFHRYEDGSASDRARFAVEVLVHGEVTDDLGSTVRVRQGRLRYELTVDRSTAVGGEVSVLVSEESLTGIDIADDAWLRRTDMSTSINYSHPYLPFARCRQLRAASS